MRVALPFGNTTRILCDCFLSTDTQVKAKDRDIIDAASWEVDESSMKASFSIYHHKMDKAGLVFSYSSPLWKRVS